MAPFFATNKISIFWILNDHDNLLYIRVILYKLYGYVIIGLGGLFTILYETLLLLHQDLSHIQAYFVIEQIVCIKQN